MSTNQYFSNYTNTQEQDLIESLVIEAIQIKGLNVKYIPRISIEDSILFGEIKESFFNLSVEIEMYPEDVERYGGQGGIFNNIGYEINDTMSMVVSKSRFKEEFPNMQRPYEGDLIYLPVTNALFEIKFVDHEDPFFQKGKNYVYKLKLELFEYNNETFETNDNIDNLLSNILSTDQSEEVSELYGDNDILENIGNEESFFDPNNPFGV